MTYASRMYFIGLLSGFGVGAFVMAGIFTVATEEVGLTPKEITEEEYSAGLRMSQPLVPMKIKLTILPDDEFDSIRKHKSAEGFAVLGNNDRQCEIVLPVRTGAIQFYPGILYSPVFNKHHGVDDWGGRALTHEILHCMIGWWHK